MVTKPTTSFGALLRHHRQAVGLSQEELAERAELSVRAVSDLERGIRLHPYPHTIEQLAVALGLAGADRARFEAAGRMRPASAAASRAGDEISTNLPLQLTSFIGREWELGEVRRLLGQTRLLTLTGTGGCGKTRLALQVAAELVEAYPDGIWLVELAALTDPALVPPAVAHALDVPEQPGRPPLATLADALRAKRLLLVLDNCEHLLDACADLVETLLRAGPGLRVLATSRELLGATGETTWRVPSLTVPDPAHLPSLAVVAEAEAVRLFIERARLVRPDFALTAENAAAVAQVCQRLDGIPLAIELAAARLTALTPAQLAARLDDRFRLLTGGRRTALRRQQTLQAAIDWSHDLLTEPERVLLRRLAVFAGGWALEAAEAVGAGDHIESWAVLDLLTHLVEKSLVVAEEQAGTERYRLLETIRQYAGEKLLAAGEAADVRDRHRDWYLALAEAAEPGLWGPEQGAWLDRLDTEHDNLRTALAWCQATAPPEGLRLAASLFQFWRVRGHQSESRRWLSDLLALAPAPTAARAKALVMGGMAARERAERAAGRRLLEESLAIYRVISDRAGQAYALNELASVVGPPADPSGQAEALLEEGLALARSVGDARRVRSILTMLGTHLARHGKHDRARMVLVEAVALDRQAGDVWSTAVTLLRLGQVAWMQGDAGGAGSALRESLALYRAIGDRLYIGGVLVGLGLVAHLTGDEAGARSCLDEALAVVRAEGRSMLLNTALWGLGRLAVAREEYGLAAEAFRYSLDQARGSGWFYTIFENVEGLAVVAAGCGRPERAARLLGAATALRVRHDMPVPPVDRPTQEHLLQRAEAALGQAAFAAAFAAGQVLTLEEAVAEALADEPT